MELSKKDRVMCVAVVDPFSFLGFDDGTICELAQHFNSHTHWEWVVAETWEDVDREVITCLSCVVFTDRHGSNVLLTYGTEQGSVRLCSKVVNTRNFKLIFSAKGHHDQPINQVMISESHKSGGGLIFSSLSAGGTIKVWRYLYVDLPQPHVSCIACYNSGGGIDHFIYNSGMMHDMLTQMVFLERNLENIDGKEIEGRVESHLCVITDAQNALTIYDDYYCVCSIKPVDGSSVTSCCVVSYDDLAAPKPYVRNQFITGHDNGTLQVWDLDLAFHHNKLSSHPYHHPYSFYPFYYAFHHSHGVSHPIKTTFK
jgi:WD40 repeat protein